MNRPACSCSYSQQLRWGALVASIMSSRTLSHLGRLWTKINCPPHLYFFQLYFEMGSCCCILGIVWAETHPHILQRHWTTTHVSHHFRKRTLGPRKHCLNSYYVNSNHAGKASTDFPGTYGRTSSHHEMRWHWCLTAAYLNLITVWSQAFWCNLTLATPQEVSRQFMLLCSGLTNKMRNCKEWNYMRINSALA